MRFALLEIRNLIQGFVALATAAKEGLPLVPLWTLSAPPEHGFHFIHEMHYSSIAYFQGVVTGKDVKREFGVWFWQKTRPDPLYSLFQGVMTGGGVKDGIGAWYRRIIF